MLKINNTFNCKVLLTSFFIINLITILGFFIAWFTLTGSAQDIVGIAIIVSIAIWLLTIYMRD